MPVDSRVPAHVLRWAGGKMPVEYYDAGEYRHKPRQSPDRWRRLVWVLVGKYRLTVGEVATVLHWPTYASLQRLERAAAKLPRRFSRGIESGEPVKPYTRRPNIEAHMQLSEHFELDEFRCHHCGKAVFAGNRESVSPELVAVLERVRVRFGAPVRVLSGYRCPSHNAAVGGAKNSQHMQGIAADIVVGGVEPAAVADWLEGEYPRSFGIGRYADWTHIDVRRGSARWIG